MYEKPLMCALRKISNVGASVITVVVVVVNVGVERMRCGSGKDSGSEEAKRGPRGLWGGPEFRSPWPEMAFFFF